MNSEIYLNMIKNCNSQQDAERITDIIYSGTVSSAFKLPFKADWNVFYALKDLEDKYSLPHFSSSYIVINLVQPVMISLWEKKDVVKKWASYEDYVSETWMFIATDAIYRWDKDINDNFYAFINKELRTPLNSTTKEEIPDYFKKTYGYRIESFNAILEKNENKFDVVDNVQDVENSAINRVAYQENKSLRDLVGIKENPTDNEIKTQIKNSLIVSLLFGGISNELARRIQNVLDERECCIEME